MMSLSRGHVVGFCNIRRQKIPVFFRTMRRLPPPQPYETNFIIRMMATTFWMIPYWPSMVALKQSVAKFHSQNTILMKIYIHVTGSLPFIQPDTKLPKLFKASIFYILVKKRFTILFNVALYFQFDSQWDLSEHSKEQSQLWNYK